MDHISADDLAELQQIHAKRKQLSNAYGDVSLQLRHIVKQQDNLAAQFDAASEQVLALNKRLQAKYGISDNHRISLETGEIVE